jgi:integrase/recombinase XerD
MVGILNAANTALHLVMWRVSGATGITIYLENDGRHEHAQQMASHESPRTTKLYDRTKDEITLTEVERIRV